MKRRTARAAKDSGAGGCLNSLEQRFFYQALAPDIQMLVLQGVKFRLSRDGLPEDPGLLDLDDLAVERAGRGIQQVPGRWGCRHPLLCLLWPP